MLTKLRIRNSKQSNDAERDLSQSIVFIGLNNSEKTSAFQALGLWDSRGRARLSKRRGTSKSEKRSGATINRRDIFPTPVPSSQFLWRNLHVREGITHGGRRVTKSIRVSEIVCSGGEEGDGEAYRYRDFVAAVTIILKTSVPMYVKKAYRITILKIFQQQTSKLRKA